MTYHMLVTSLFRALASALPATNANENEWDDRPLAEDEFPNAQSVKKRTIASAIEMGQLFAIHGRSYGLNRGSMMMIQYAATTAFSFLTDLTSHPDSPRYFHQTLGILNALQPKLLTAKAILRMVQKSLIEAKLHNQLLPETRQLLEDFDGYS
jgi:hypothetical protein